MSIIEELIGSNRALELSFNSRNRILSAEDWFAELVERRFDDYGEEIAGCA